LEKLHGRRIEARLREQNRSSMDGREVSLHRGSSNLTEGTDRKLGNGTFLGVVGEPRVRIRNDVSGGDARSPSA
jgi:hypothetical protein